MAEILDGLRVLDHELVPDGLTSETLIATDEEVACTIQHALWDVELLHQPTNENVEIMGEENDERESTEKKLSSKKALYEAVNLIESFALFQSDDLAKQLRKHTAQFNDVVASSSREDKSTVNTFFKPI